MNFLKGLFKPGGDTIKGALEGAGDLAQDVRAAITGEMTPDKMAELGGTLLQLYSALTAAQSSIVQAEANGQSWLQRNWRPIVMLFFAFIIGMIFFGKTPPGVTEAIQLELMGILKIGLGGYVVAQSAEVVADKWNKN
jgi:hypothetical protein